MFKENDEVTLEESAGPFDSGAEGVVISIPETDVLQVEIHTDESGRDVNPPFLLPPLQASNFKKIER